jgi:hypothetical protein
MLTTVERAILLFMHNLSDGGEAALERNQVGRRGTMPMGVKV